MTVEYIDEYIYDRFLYDRFLIKNEDNEIIGIHDGILSFANKYVFFRDIVSLYTINADYLLEFINKYSRQYQLCDTIWYMQKIPYDFIIKNIRTISFNVKYILYSQELSPEEILNLSSWIEIEERDKFLTHKIQGEHLKRYCSKCSTDAWYCFSNNCDEAIMKRVLG